MCHVMPGIASNELTLPTAHAAQQTEDVRLAELLFNHLTAAHWLRMLSSIPRRAGQQRNTGMISSVEAPSADPAEQPRIVVAAVPTHKSALKIHEALLAPPSVEEDTPSRDQEQDQVFVAWTAYCDDESRMRWWLRNPTGTRIPRIPAHYPSITRWSS
jgi:hypothetical protein